MSTLPEFLLEPRCLLCGHPTRPQEGIKHPVCEDCEAEEASKLEKLLAKPHGLPVGPEDDWRTER